MYWTKRHVLVCTASHCSQKGANDVVGRLRLEVIRRGLDAEILVNNCGTIDLCDIGPNIVVYPDNVVLHGVRVADVKEVVDYLGGGAVPERLVLRPRAGAEEERRRFYRAAVAPDPDRPSDEFEQLAAAHGFGPDWVAEQQRRGFIARKPPGDGGPDRIVVTSKARHRYGV